MASVSPHRGTSVACCHRHAKVADSPQNLGPKMVGNNNEVMLNLRARHEHHISNPLGESKSFMIGLEFLMRLDDPRGGIQTAESTTGIESLAPGKLHGWLAPLNQWLIGMVDDPGPDGQRV